MKEYLNNFRDKTNTFLTKERSKTVFGIACILTVLGFIGFVSFVSEDIVATSVIGFLIFSMLFRGWLDKTKTQ